MKFDTSRPFFVALVTNYTYCISHSPLSSAPTRLAAPNHSIPLRGVPGAVEQIS